MTRMAGQVFEAPQGKGLLVQLVPRSGSYANGVFGVPGVPLRIVGDEERQLRNTSWRSMQNSPSMDLQLLQHRGDPMFAP
jgi:hypothetical protein